MKINKEECPRDINLVTEDFSSSSDSTVTCTRCGAQAHDPSLLCSPDVTLASSTQLRGDFSSSQSSLGQSQSEWSQSQSQGSQSQGSQSKSQSNLSSSKSSLSEDIEEDVNI